MRRWPQPQRGAAAIEHLGMVALIAAVVASAAAAIAGAPPERSARELGATLARRLACVPRHPVPCGRHPLALAYGAPVGKLVRQIAPPSLAPIVPGGVPLLPVDFRRCRRASCARPGPRAGLTASMRRVTVFTSVEDLRPSGGGLKVSYWLYRPSLGWNRIVRLAGDSQIAAASGLRLNLEDDPALIPLETLPGRDHYVFPPGEEPPWRWSIASGPSGRSFD